MSYATAKPIRPEGMFTGGYVDNTPDTWLADKFSPFSRNTRLNGESTVIRPGHTLHAEFTGSDFPRGIGSYLRSDPTNDTMVVRYNETGTEKLITVDEDSNQVPITTAALIASDNRMEFQNVEDVIYCMNGEDDFGKLDGTTYTLPSTGITNFAPAFSVVFNGSHWASGWDVNSNKVYKSVADDYEDFNSTGSDIFTFQEQIVGLGTNSQGLFYYTNNSISVTGLSDIQDTAGSITYITRALTVKEGSVNHAGIVAAGNNIYHITPSNKIVTITRGQNIDGFETFELSERKYKGISKIMRTLDADQTECFGYFLPQDNLIKWHFKTIGSTFNNVVVVYDITKDAFLVDNNKIFYDGIEFKSNYYTVSNLEPKMFQDEFGTDDEDASIQFRYESKEMDYGNPTHKKEIWESRTFTSINELAVLEQQILIDGNVIDTKVIDSNNIPITTTGTGTFPIGTEAVGTGGASVPIEYDVDILRTKGNLQVKGKKIKFIYTCGEVGAKVTLKDLEMMIELLTPASTELTI